MEQEKLFWGPFVMLLPLITLVVLYYLFLFVREYRRIEFMEQLIQLTVGIFAEGLAVFSVGFHMIFLALEGLYLCVCGNEDYYIRQVERANNQSLSLPPQEDDSYFRSMKRIVFGDEDKYITLIKGVSGEEEFERSLKKQ